MVNHAAFLVDTWDGMGLGNHLLQPKLRKSGLYLTIFTKDPDGNVIELVKEDDL